MATTGLESSLSPWAGPYVTDILGKGEALASTPYTAFGGPLTAGPSELQSKAFQGIGALGIPQATSVGSFTGSEYVPPTAANALTGATAAEGYFGPASGNVVQNYMNPYLEAALQPQYAQAAEDYGIAQRDLQSRYANAGAYGGSRQGVAEGMLGGKALQNMSAITGRGYEQAYANAQDMFNKDRTYGLDALMQQADLGQVQRDIEGQGVAADIAQFQEERDYPYKQLQYQQSLLEGLPISTQAYNFSEPSTFNQAAGGAGTVIDLMRSIGFFGGNS
tara:strand:- start:64 stop:894 length:831 start_codon:yes stop_codon:yes gene_type:complete